MNTAFLDILRESVPLQSKAIYHNIIIIINTTIELTIYYGKENLKFYPFVG
ncbi:MAG: hypothetical protein Harvfovirus1_7 [Harvfovirus sp.]|uniref:Uncharacterized protein n=1 Tax=Harvfovirus sp. TaxID=2487768 RepID=A0A3G4ZZR1_9VIRU|nr:MAG: hypothetical protein Harvfovirus1_7 [Harvfovirus sp.]